ncbi:hypothetical protein [Pseudonocardia charpentierae]|uniref:Uncharacterized protein n=1 Tax=Pseudonocardia charpentierae TaxID=3075545 RepID=A0ABU2NCI5_9PSEU|nr:hypothetical protein [Pseudonocardia sp. DSM 45834]MDT0351663.1 hypothetical protein [Pseudonocardia sp. DSM 45834]
MLVKRAVTGNMMLSRRPGNDQVAPVATARAAGVPVHVLRTPDPHGSGELVTALLSAPQEKVLALGAAFGSVEQLQQRLAVVRTGVQLPGCGQLAFPGHRMIAPYGTPGTAALGRPCVDAAKGAGVYVVLDLQPGRTDFLTQARHYEELLAEPHVGLALDPKWRLQPQQVLSVQIGPVNVDEVNQVGNWLAAFVPERNLPQKLPAHRATLDTSPATSRPRATAGSPCPAAAPDPAHSPRHVRPDGL